MDAIKYEHYETYYNGLAITIGFTVDEADPDTGIFNDRVDRWCVIWIEGLEFENTEKRKEALNYTKLLIIRNGGEDAIIAELYEYMKGAKDDY